MGGCLDRPDVHIYIYICMYVYTYIDIDRHACILMLKQYPFVPPPPPPPLSRLQRAEELQTRDELLGETMFVMCLPVGLG